MKPIGSKLQNYIKIGSHPAKLLRRVGGVFNLWITPVDKTTRPLQGATNMALTSTFNKTLDKHGTLMARAYKRLTASRLRLARGVALALVGSLCLAQPTSQAQIVHIKDLEPTLYSIKIIGYQESVCLWQIARKESNIRFNAINRSSGALGAFQIINPRVKYLTPNQQIDWAVRYANHRYGGVCKAWDRWKVQRWW